MIEFVAALVVLLIITTGLFHINRMTRSSLFLHSVLRAKAGEKAMSSTIVASAPEPIRDWDAGPDGLTYTADDQKKTGNTPLFSTVQRLTQYSTENHSEDDWTFVRRYSQLPTSMLNLQETISAGALLRVVREEESLLVPVEPVIHDLVYDKEEVEIKENVSMPLMGGLY